MAGHQSTVLHLPTHLPMSVDAPACTHLRRPVHAGACTHLHPAGQRRRSTHLHPPRCMLLHPHLYPPQCMLAPAPTCTRPERKARTSRRRSGAPSTGAVFSLLTAGSKGGVGWCGVGWGFGQMQVARRTGRGQVREDTKNSPAPAAQPHPWCRKQQPTHATCAPRFKPHSRAMVGTIRSCRPAGHDERRKSAGGL